MLVASIGALAQPGQPHLHTPPGGVVAKFCGQAHHPHGIRPAGQPPGQQLPVIDEERAQFR